MAGSLNVRLHGRDMLVRVLLALLLLVPSTAAALFDQTKCTPETSSHNEVCIKAVKQLNCQLTGEYFANITATYNTLLSQNDKWLAMRRNRPPGAPVWHFARVADVWATEDFCIDPPWQNPPQACGPGLGNGVCGSPWELPKLQYGLPIGDVPIWSPLPGEESIAYGIGYKSDGCTATAGCARSDQAWIIRYDAEANTIDSEWVVVTSPGANGQTPNANLDTRFDLATQNRGFTGDGKLYLPMNSDAADANQPIMLVDVVNRTAEVLPFPHPIAWTDAWLRTRLPMHSTHGHSTRQEMPYGEVSVASSTALNPYGQSCGSFLWGRPMLRGNVNTGVPTVSAIGSAINGLWACFSNQNWNGNHFNWRAWRDSFLFHIGGDRHHARDSSIMQGFPFLGVNKKLLDIEISRDFVGSPAIGDPTNCGFIRDFAVISTDDDTLSIWNHQVNTGAPLTVVNSGGALPAGLSAGTTYYAKVVDPNIITLSLTAGGANVNITGNGTGVHTLRESPEGCYYTSASFPSMGPGGRYMTFATDGGNFIGPSGQQNMNFYLAKLEYPNRRGLPVIETYEASTQAIASSGQVVLSWAVRGADTVEILSGSQGLGTVAAVGTGAVTANNTRNFVLQATNSHGVVTRTIPITVGALPTNQITDGSFESQTLGATSFAPSTWTLNNGQVQIVESPARSGRRALYLKNTGSLGPKPPTAHGRVHKTVASLAAVQNKLVRASVWAKSDSPTGTPAGDFGITITNPAGTRLCMRRIGQIPPVWTRYEHIVQVPADASLARIDFYAVQNNTQNGVYLDDFEIVVLDPVPTPVIKSFVAEPSTIDVIEGELLTLKWEVEGATSISFNNDIGSVFSNETQSLGSTLECQTNPYVANQTSRQMQKGSLILGAPPSVIRHDGAARNWTITASNGAATVSQAKTVNFPTYTGLKTLWADFTRGEEVYDKPWTTARMLAFHQLAGQEENYLLFQYGRTPANSHVISSLAWNVNALQAVYPESRICTSERLDIAPTKYVSTHTAAPYSGGVDGGQGNCLCDATNDGAGPSPSGVCGTTPNHCDDTWNPAAGGFDAQNCVLRMSKVQWNKILDERWGGLDPFLDEGGHTWGASVDKAAILALVDDDSVPVVYQSANGDNMNIADVLFDVRKPECRAWRAQHMIAKLNNMGITGSEHGCIAIANKPGHHTRSAYRNPDPEFSACANASDRQYFPAPWGETWAPVGCPEVNWLTFPTEYGWGEYEAGSKAFAFELAEALDDAGMPNIKILWGDGGVELAPQDGSRDHELGEFRKHPRYRGPYNTNTSDIPVP